MEPRTDRRPALSQTRLLAAAACAAAALLFGARQASAQLDPLLFLQRNQPNVIIAVDVANRMQFDANGNYFDPYDYPRTGAGWEANALDGVPKRVGVPPDVQVAGEASAHESGCLHRRSHPGHEQQRPDLQHVLVADASGGGARGSADCRSEQRPRRPIRPPENAPDEPAHRGRANDGPVYVTSPTQQSPTPSGADDGRWRITTTVVDASNGAVGWPAAPLIAPDAAGASSSVATYLGDP